MTISRDALKRVRSLAATQDWVVTSAQLREAGVERGAAQRMALSGPWVRLAMGSYWVGPGPRGPGLRARVRGVLLQCGPQVMACGLTAARLHGIQGLPWDDGTLYLAAPPSREVRSRPGIHVQRTRVPTSDRMDSRGIALTCPSRTCADLLLQLDQMEAVSALDSALHQRLLTAAHRETVLAHLRRRPGACRARGYVDLADGRAESPLETRIRLICHDAGLPRPILQWAISDPTQGCTYRIDLGWPAHLVGVEADGKLPHNTPDAIYQDRFRQNRLMALLPGLSLLRFTWDDTRAPEAILISLRQALSRVLPSSTATPYPCASRKSRASRRT